MTSGRTITLYHIESEWYVKEIRKACDCYIRLDCRKLNPGFIMFRLVDLQLCNVAGPSFSIQMHSDIKDTKKWSIMSLILFSSSCKYLFRYTMVWGCCNIFLYLKEDWRQTSGVPVLFSLSHGFLICVNRGFALSWWSLYEHSWERRYLEDSTCCTKI